MNLREKKIKTAKRNGKLLAMTTWRSYLLDSRIDLPKVKPLSLLRMDSELQTRQKTLINSTQ